jgi:hypothetical protein
VARVSAALLAASLAVLCRQPGFRRAGQAHPARAEYPPGHFTEEQLEAMAAEPMLQLLPIEIPEGEGAEGNDVPGGPVPQPSSAGGDAPTDTAAAGAGDDHAPGIANGDGTAATGAAPVSTTDAPREDGGDGSDAGASTDEQAGGAAPNPAPADASGDNQAASPAQEGGAVSGDAAPAARAPAAQVPRPARRGRG